MDRDHAIQRYESCLADFLAGRSEAAFYAVDQLGRELVTAGQGPDILIDLHAQALRRQVADADPLTISRMVVNANDLLLNAIMAYAMTHYTFQDQLAAERRKLEAAQAQAQAERDRLDEIVSAIDADLLLLDAEMRILWVNRRARERPYRSNNDLVGTLCYEDYCNVDHPPGDCPARLAFATGRPVRREHAITHPDGSTGYYYFTCSPILDDDGRVVQVLELVQDITARKRLEEEVAAKARALAAANEELKGLDRLKSMFIASMSHELRTPLNAIIGFSGVMLQGLLGELTEDQADAAGRIQRAGKHLLALVNDIIDISKIESGKITPYAEDFDLAGLVSEAVETVAGEAAAKGLDLQSHLPREPVHLHTDRKRLLQCLLNYLANAVKFTPAGGEVAVTATTATGRLRLAVRDSGPGISEADQQRLFTAFSRLATPGTTEVPGTGLGLYLTKKLAQEVLAGEVFVDSTPGEGSCFGLEIPLRLPPRDDDQGARP